MDESPESGGGSSAGAGPQSQRWPRVVGTIGVVAGAIMFLDKLDDLLMLPLLRSPEWWASVLGEKLAADVVRWMPPAAWIVSASVIGMALGALLVTGAVKLRRGRRSGAALCRTWAWLALVWLLVEMGWAYYWFSGRLGELMELAPGGMGSAVVGTVLVFVVLAALPVFLLSWFARPAIKTQLAGWPQ